MKVQLLIFLLVLQAQFAFCQEDKTNNLDSTGNKADLKLYYDADSILFKKVWYSQGVADSVQYFDVKEKKVDTIITFDKLLVQNKEIANDLKKIKKKITSEFDWRNVLPREGQGTVIISFMITPTLEISNVRVINGISKSLNQELVRATSNLDKSDVECCNDEDFPVLVFLPISF